MTDVVIYQLSAFCYCGCGCLWGCGHYAPCGFCACAPCSQERAAAVRAASGQAAPVAGLAPEAEALGAGDEEAQIAITPEQVSVLARLARAEGALYTLVTGRGRDEWVAAMQAVGNDLNGDDWVSNVARNGLGWHNRAEDETEAHCA